MIFPGTQVRSSVFCPTCGNALNNNFPPHSAFLSCYCSNEDCDDKGVVVLIEKATLLVVTVNPQQYLTKALERAYPMLADKDGKQVWPKVGE